VDVADRAIWSDDGGPQRRGADVNDENAHLAMDPITAAKCSTWGADVEIPLHLGFPRAKCLAQLRAICARRLAFLACRAPWAVLAVVVSAARVGRFEQISARS